MFWADSFNIEKPQICESNCIVFVFYTICAGQQPLSINRFDYIAKIVITSSNRFPNHDGGGTLTSWNDCGEHVKSL